MAEEDIHREYDIALELINEGEYEEALRLLDRIAAQRPDSKHVMCSRGFCFTALGRLEEAHAVRDRLAGLSGVAARKLLEKLDEKLNEKLEERERELRRGQRRASRSTMSEEIGPGFVKSLFKAVLILGLIALGYVAAVYFIRNQQAAQRRAVESEETLTLGTNPDGYLETATFFPSGTDRLFRYAVFLAAPESEVSNEPTDAKDDCAGAPVVTDWAEVKARAKKALTMSNSSTEDLRGTPRNRLVCTAVLPKVGATLSGRLANKQVETFSPASVTDLAAVTSACGRPDRTEAWVQNGRYVGIAGPTQWWGRVGLAADANGKITHVLIRAYPGDKR